MLRAVMSLILCHRPASRVAPERLAHLTHPSGPARGQSECVYASSPVSLLRKVSLSCCVYKCHVYYTILYYTVLYFIPCIYCPVVGVMTCTCRLPIFGLWLGRFCRQSRGGSPLIYIVLIHSY